VALELAHHFARRRVPPDQLAIVTAGDELSARERQSRHIAGVARHRDGRKFLSRAIKVIDVAIGTAEKDALRARHAREAKAGVSAAEFLRDFEFRRVDHLTPGL